MKPFHSIRLRIRLLVALLVAGLVASSALSVKQALYERRQARHVEMVANISRDLLSALDLLRDERGVTAALIIRQGALNPDQFSYQGELRAKSTPLMRKTLALLTAISPNTDVFYRMEIARRFDHLQALRAEADLAISLPVDRRPRDLHARFIADMTDLTDALTEATAKLTADMSQHDAYIARMANTGRLAWTVRGAAGDDSLRWWTAGFAGRRLTADQINEFATLKARVDAPWSVLKADAAHDDAPDGVAKAIVRAQRLYFGINGQLRTEILDALMNGRRVMFPTKADRLINSQGLSSLMGVADAAFGAIAAHAAAEAADAERQAYLALAAMVVSIGLGVGISAFARAQVLSPLGRITGAMRAVAEGDFEHAIPDMERPDEVGELARALNVFRANAKAKAALDEQLLESRVAREAAEASARAKAQFLANMSHEIRTPLTAVIGFADLMAADSELPETAKTYTGRIQVASKALLALVNDILDVSRIEAGHVELNTRPCDVNSLIGETLELVRLAADRKGLSLIVRLEGIPKHVMADTARLRQVLLNLLSNAIKFTLQGSVTVDARYRPDGDGRLSVRISDTGPGISEEDRLRLFHRFSQLDASNTRQFGGAGLGLAISKGLVELMGGEIGLESTEGVGSTFWFDLPAPIATESAAPRHSALAKPANSEKRKALRILVVDDLAVNRELVSAMLSPFDLHLTLAASGAEAVAAANRDAFDLILMDVQMPGMDGLAATRAIRAASSPNATAPILALSANVMEQQVEACRAAGMNDHIAKPIDPAELIGKIDLWAAGVDWSSPGAAASDAA
jgi:signal transduction histidine kinase/ActR/RegA family two-component response regulator